VTMTTENNQGKRLCANKWHGLIRKAKKQSSWVQSRSFGTFHLPNFSNGVLKSRIVCGCYHSLGRSRLNEIDRRAARLLAIAKKTKTQTNHQILDEREKMQSLRRDINAWCEARTLYIPIATVLEENAALECPTGNVGSPWDLRLWLPSMIPSDVRTSGCAHGLPELETSARIASAISALTRLRMSLRLLAHAIQTTRTHIYGTGERHMTRARARIQAFINRRDKAAALYRASYNALLTLNPEKIGCELLMELRSEDVSGPTREIDEVMAAQQGQDISSLGRYTASWIWVTYGATSSVDGDSDAQEQAEKQLFNAQLRTAWAKARGRHERWLEEILLLHVEMCRTLRALESKADWWLERSTAHNDSDPLLDPVLSSGLNAYTLEQRAVYLSIARAFALKWAPVLMRQQMHGPWLWKWLPADYTPPPLRPSRAKVPLTDPIFERPSGSEYLTDLFAQVLGDESGAVPQASPPTARARKLATDDQDSDEDNGDTLVKDIEEELDVDSDFETDQYLWMDDDEEFANVDHGPTEEDILDS
jgi:hypothetical protein